MNPMPDLVELLIRRRDLYPSRCAIIFEDQEIDYLSLYERSIAVASQFARLNLTGSPIFVWSPTRAELPIIYYAAFMSGAVVVPINYSFRAPEVTNILANCRPQALITHPSLSAEVRKLDRSLLDAIPHKFVMGAPAMPHLAGFTPFAELEATCGGGSEKNSDAPAIIFHTSGTTGKPKGVIHTLRSLSCFASGYARLCKGDDSPVTIVARNCYHSGGFYHLMGALSYGTTCVICDTGSLFDADDYLRKTLEYRATQMFLNVAMLNAVLKASSLRAEHFSQALFISAGADYVRPQHHDELSKYTDKALITRYSSTEATCVTINDSPDVETRRNTIGRPLPHVEFEIDCPDTSGVGELLLRGEGLFLGYYNNPEENKCCFNESGWFKSGDLVRRDRTGNLVFLGRSRRIIKVSGKVVYPQEIEEVADTYHAFEQTVAVPVAHEIEVQVPFLFAKLREFASDIDWSDFLAFMNERIANYKIPVGLSTLADLPLTVAGKVNREQLELEAARIWARN
jgi:long-chain acyl-CoA synthetase